MIWGIQKLKFLGLLAVASLNLATASHAAQTAGEYEVKAAFLFNFVQFVEWPQSAFPDATAPIVIGVLGTDPFGDVLDRIVAGEKTNGRAIRVERYRRVQDVQQCHILFVARSEASRLAEILGALEGRSVLTVGEFEGFATAGGMIRFLTEDDRIRFRINLDAAKSARLTISSKLLRPSETIRKGD